MADISDLLKLIQQQAFLQSGGGQKYITQGLDQIAGTVGTGSEEVSKLKKEKLARQKALNDLIPIGQFSGVPSADQEATMKQLFENKQSTVGAPNIFPQPTPELENQDPPATPEKPSFVSPREQFTKQNGMSPDIPISLAKEYATAKALGGSVPLYVDSISGEVGTTKTVNSIPLANVSQKQAADIMAKKANAKTIANAKDDIPKAAAKAGAIKAAQDAADKASGKFQTVEEKQAAINQAKLDKEKPKARGSLQNALALYDSMINEAQSIANDPDLGKATGIMSFAGKIPATGAKRVSARIDTLKAKTLLNVLSSLKQLSTTGASGFGQLSDTEGKAITSSISSLDKTMGTQDFKDSLSRFVDEMKARKQNLQDTFDATYGGSISSPAPSGGIPGTTKTGMKYKVIP